MPDTTLDTSQPVEITSTDDLNRAVRDYLGLTAEIEAQQTELAGEVAPIKERYHAKIDRRSAKQLQIADAAIAYAHEHKLDLPLDGQTLHLPSGDILYRAGSTTVKLTKPQAEVIAALKEAGFDDLVDTEESVSKSRAKKNEEALTAGLGLELHTADERITIKARKST